MHDIIDIIRKFRIILTKKQKKRIFLIGVLMVIGAILEVVGVSLIVPLISLILEKDFFETNVIVISLSSILGIKTANSFIVFMLIALAFVYIIKNAFLLFEYYVQLRFIRGNKLRARVNSMWVYLNKPYEFYFHAKPGELLRETSTDITNTYNMLQELMSLCTELVIVAFLMVTVFVIDSLMAALTSFIILIELIVIYKIIKPILKKAGQMWNISIANSNKWMLQSFDGIKEIKVARKEAYFLKRFDNYAEESSKSEFTCSIFSHVPRLMIESVTVASMLVVVSFIVILGGSIETILPKLSAFAVAAVKLLPSVNRISTSLNQLTYNKVCLDNSSKTIEPNDERVKPGEDAKMKEKLVIDSSIELKGIDYKYPDTDHIILDDVDMVIPVGSMVGIIGESGAGKTTIVDIILGLLRPVKGDIMADGNSILNKKDEFLNNVGYIPQHIFMMDGSIQENVAFGKDKDRVDEERVWKCLREAELEDFVKGLPDGLHTEIGEKGVRLSGGQKQRIGIARALYGNPRILVFDEATSALDNKTEMAVMESIEHLHGKVTLIIIAHRLTTIENCDIVYEISDRKVKKVR